MEDILTSADVQKSIEKLRLRDDTRANKLAAFVRESLPDPSFQQAIRRGEIQAWERALAHVIAVQGFFRVCDERTEEDGRLAYTVVDESEERTGYLRALAETDLGYVHDPSWTNGGLASHGADPAPLEDGVRDPLPALRHVAAYAMVVQVDGVPEVAWQYSASTFELGISSIHDAMVAKLLLGDSMGGGSSDPPEGPTDSQIQAASLQRRIRERLGRLPHRLQAVLELAYTDRRYENQLVSDYGIGLAPLVWRAAERAGDVRDGRVRTNIGTLRALVDDVRKEWPTYEAPQTGNLKHRIKAVAELLLWTAHAWYEALSGDPPQRPQKARRKRRTPVLEVASQPRDLVEVRSDPRAAA
jgi:hypothetical protein